MDIGELVNVVLGGADDGPCPFDHRPREHTKENVLPPPKTKNNASKLSSSLDGESKHVEPMGIVLKGNDEVVHFSAHHLVPGNETWPRTALYKWIDKRSKTVCGDIGYDVNSAKNGADLPSHAAAIGWKGKTPKGQAEYAFAAMAADGKGRQFHDRHPAYSDFVVNTMDKIAAALDGKETPGCGKKNCGGGNQKPFDPPYGLLPRIDGVAARLRTKLLGYASNWRPPIMTSRFALMLKNRAKGMTQAEARRLLATDQFDYGG